MKEKFVWFFTSVMCYRFDYLASLNNVFFSCVCPEVLIVYDVIGQSVHEIVNNIM